MSTKIIKAASETRYGLTFGKIYNVIEESFIAFKIMADDGIARWYRKDYFFGINAEIV